MNEKASELDCKVVKEVREAVKSTEEYSMTGAGGWHKGRRPGRWRTMRSSRSRRSRKEVNRGGRQDIEG
jgi:hypothetical protein